MESTQDDGRVTAMFRVFSATEGRQLCVDMYIRIHVQYNMPFILHDVF